MRAVLPCVLLMLAVPLAQAQTGKSGASAAKAAGATAPASSGFSPGALLGGTDSCATPVPIAGQGNFNFDTSSATTGTEGQNEASCLAFGTTGIANDVWFCWTADANGCTTLTTCNLTASVDTKVAVYPGCGCPADGTSLACNDDLCPGTLETTLNWDTVNGTTYTIQVGTFPGAVGGAGVMTLSTVASACPTAPANDDCATPEPIAGQGTFPFDLSLTTTGTEGQNEAACIAFGTSGIDADVWFCWTSDCDGTATVTTCNLTTVDTRIAVYPGCGCPLDGSAITCNDDDCNLQSTVTWAATSGTTYTIQLGTFPGAVEGTGSFDVSVSPCTGAGTPVCFGDGSGAACGCLNESMAGSMSGCLNSVSVGNFGAQLTGSGTPSVTADTLVLDCSGVLTQPGLMFQGNNTIAGGNGQTFGDGLRCCGGGVVRLQLINPPPGPEPVSVTSSVTISTEGAPGTTTPGDKRCYQYWYRDPQGPCGTTFNLSSAITVTWQP